LQTVQILTGKLGGRLAVKLETLLIFTTSDIGVYIRIHLHVKEESMGPPELTNQEDQRNLVKKTGKFYLIFLKSEVITVDSCGRFSILTKFGK
jgi:hypothetical protein